MDDKSIEMLLSEKKFISKRDIEFIRKQAIGNNISFKIAIAQLKRISLGTIFYISCLLELVSISLSPVIFRILNFMLLLRLLVLL
ncbi:putative inner membrane protein [Yersinia enterocolitica]|nr:putative inner membrane protein [Yersinia enterocolitica]